MGVGAGKIAPETELSAGLRALGLLGTLRFEATGDTFKGTASPFEDFFPGEFSFHEAMTLLYLAHKGCNYSAHNAGSGRSEAGRGAMADGVVIIIVVMS